MKASEAKEKVCPFISIPSELTNCICEKCMFWVNTVNGKKEVARYKIPYDTYPYNESIQRKQLREDGYEEIRLQGEISTTFIKYEESHEGFCQKLQS